VDEFDRVYGKGIVAFTVITGMRRCSCYVRVFVCVRPCMFVTLFCRVCVFLFLQVMRVFTGSSMRAPRQLALFDVFIDVVKVVAQKLLLT